jgi:hypothetical protein
MDFRITGLAAATFRSLFVLSSAELAARSAVRMVADRRPGFPCRISLRDADPGESVLLLNFEHLSVATPYRSRHAIFVRENAAEARLAVNEVPQMLLTRLLSLRAFDGAGMMLDAEVMQGHELALWISKMLHAPAVQYLHVHNAKPGCYAARVERIAA